MIFDVHDGNARNFTYPPLQIFIASCNNITLVLTEVKQKKDSKGAGDKHATIGMRRQQGKSEHFPVLPHVELSIDHAAKHTRKRKEPFIHWLIHYS